jgi:hypothetical protein
VRGSTPPLLDGLTFSTTVISPTFPVFPRQRVDDRRRRCGTLGNPSE